MCGIILKTADITKVAILVALTSGLKMYLEYCKRHYKYNYKVRAKLAHIPSDEERVKAKRM